MNFYFFSEPKGSNGFKPSQLPGEYTALCNKCATQLNQSQEPSLPSQVPIYPWVERSNYSEVSCSGTQVSRPGFEPKRCWTESPELESGALTLSAMTPQSFNMHWNFDLPRNYLIFTVCLFCHKGSKDLTLASFRVFWFRIANFPQKTKTKIKISHGNHQIALKPLDTFGTETKIKVHRFTNNL